MDIQKPEWWDEWIEGSAGDLRLKAGAPKDIQRQFDDLMHQLREIHQPPSDCLVDIPCKCTETDDVQ